MAAHDLRAGHTLVDSDLVLQAMPANAVASDALTDIQQAVGQTLKIDRGQGDILRTSNFGEMITLQPDERAVAVKVTDATGLVGLLIPGQKVGIVASVEMQSQDSQGTFSKATIEGLRVLYLDPRFATSDSTTVQATSNSSSLVGTGGIDTSTERAQQGFVVLAVPTNLQTVVYDFTAANAVSESRSVNVLEMLAALGTANGADISLYLMPGEDAKQFSSPGFWLPNLVVTPQATPTATSTIVP